MVFTAVPMDDTSLYDVWACFFPVIVMLFVLGLFCDELRLSSILFTAVSFFSNLLFMS